MWEKSRNVRKNVFNCFCLFMTEFMRILKICSSYKTVIRYVMCNYFCSWYGLSFYLLLGIISSGKPSVLVKSGLHLVFLLSRTCVLVLYLYYVHVCMCDRYMGVKRQHSGIILPQGLNSGWKASWSALLLLIHLTRPSTAFFIYLRTTLWAVAFTL